MKESCYFRSNPTRGTSGGSGRRPPASSYRLEYESILACKGLGKARTKISCSGAALGWGWKPGRGGGVFDDFYCFDDVSFAYLAFFNGLATGFEAIEV